jgi:hypothetical protein
MLSSESLNIEKIIEKDITKAAKDSVLMERVEKFPPDQSDGDPSTSSPIMLQQ